MAAVSIRHLDDDVRERLRLRAAQHGRSMEAEMRAILTDAVTVDRQQGPFATLYDRFAELGGVDLEVPARATPARPLIFSSDRARHERGVGADAGVTGGYRSRLRSPPGTSRTFARRESRPSTRGRAPAGDDRIRGVRQPQRPKACRRGRRHLDCPLTLAPALPALKLPHPVLARHDAVVWRNLRRSLYSRIVCDRGPRP